MADFLWGESISEQIHTCPYESNHRIKLKSMEAHLEKCRNRNLPKRYMKCPYNPNHVKFVEEMQLHIEICPDMLIFGKRDGIDDEIGKIETCQIEHRDVQGVEDWDDADDNPATYDPLQKLENTRFQPKNINKRYEKIYHPDARVVLTSTPSTAKVEQTVCQASLNHLEEEFWKQRVGLPHVYEWLRNVPTPAPSEPHIDEESDQDNFPSSQTDDAGNPKKARVNPYTDTPWTNTSYDSPGPSADTDPRFIKNEYGHAIHSHINSHTNASTSYDDEFAALNGVRSNSPLDTGANFCHGIVETDGLCSSTTIPSFSAEEEFAALNAVPKFLSSGGRR